jgi:hypothetical protein
VSEDAITFNKMKSEEVSGISASSFRVVQGKYKSTGEVSGLKWP